MAKNSNQNPISKPIKYLKEVRNEITKVTWPSRNETIQMTLVVIAVSIVVGAYVGGLDFVFTKLLELVIR